MFRVDFDLPGDRYREGLVRLGLRVVKTWYPLWRFWTDGGRSDIGRGFGQRLLPGTGVVVAD